MSVSNPLDPAQLLAQIEDLNRSHENFDPLIRKQLHQAATKLSYRLEDPLTATFRYTFGQVTQSAANEVALDGGPFSALGDDDQSKTLEAIATATSMDPVLLLRILRCLATFGVVIESPEDTYELSSTCKMFGNTSYASALNRFIDLVANLMKAVPEVICENGHRTPENRLNGAAQKAFGAPGRELFDILKSMGMETVQALSTFLSMSAKNAAKLHEVCPIQERLVDGFLAEKNEIFWVDVGGGFGQYTIGPRQKFTDLPGKCVVQDLSHIIQQARSKVPSGIVEVQAHDFFETQPIHSARTYYFRQCFYNWHDENCRVMLEKTSEAMKPGYSRLLIHEIVMSEREASTWEVMMDTLMMAGYSTSERTRQQWEGLISSAGLRINKVYQDPFGAESIIEVFKEE